MDTPLKGNWITLFQVWLAAPLVFFVFWYAPYISSPKSFLANIAILIGLILVCIMLFGSEEFRKYERVTFRRILVFFVGIFLGITTLVIVFALFDHSLQFSTVNWTRHALFAAAFTPAFTLGARFYLPKPSVVE